LGRRRTRSGPQAKLFRAGASARVGGGGGGLARPRAGDRLGLAAASLIAGAAAERRPIAVGGAAPLWPLMLFRWWSRSGPEPERQHRKRLAAVDFGGRRPTFGSLDGCYCG